MTKPTGGLEGKIEDTKPDLEKIATQLANMAQNHKMDQILPTVMDTFINFKGVKYKDDRGIEQYKTKFTTDETSKIADAIFDKIAYHAHLRRYKDMTLDQFEALKKLKDPDGNPLMDAEIERAFGITRQALKDHLLKNKDDLTPDHLMSVVKQTLEHHSKYVGSRILAPLQNEENRDYIKAFIDKHVKDKKLPKKDYKLKDKYTIEDVLPLYQKIAVDFYKKSDDDKPAGKI